MRTRSFLAAGGVAVLCLAAMLPGGCGSSSAAARFATVDGWQGPAGRVDPTAAAEPLEIVFSAPTAGYQLTVDEVTATADVATVNMTLLAPAADVVVAQVVSDVRAKVDRRRFGAAPRIVVAVKQRQQGAHYLVEPPYVPALASASAR